MASIWDILEIEATTDKNLIKNAYRVKLVQANPEDHPEEFKELRMAFEQATAWAVAGGDGDIKSSAALEQDESDVGLWIRELECLYHDFYARIQPERWRLLLHNDVCISLEHSENARTAALKFFMDHMKLPNAVWKEIDTVFEICAEKQALYEVFPKEFIDYIIRLINYENFLDYTLFTGSSDEDYDAYIDDYFDLRQAVAEKKWEHAAQIYNKLDAGKIRHPFIIVELALAEAGQGHEDAAKALLEPVAKTYPDCVYIANTYAGFAMGDSDKSGSKAIYEHLLELYPENYEAKLGLARCVSAQGDYVAAKEQILDLLEINPGDERTVLALKDINTYLMHQYQEELKQKPQDLGISLDLGWCLCQNEEYERCLFMLEQLTPDEVHNYDYTNLRGRIYLCLERYADGLPWLLRWHKLITDLSDDGTKEYKKRKKRLGYAAYAIACAYAFLGEHTNKDYYENALEYIEQAISEEEETRQRYSCIYTKAELLHKTGNNERCIDLCDAMTEEESGYYPAYVLRQEAYMAMGMAQQVIDEYYRAIRIYPYHARPYELAAEVFLDFKESKESMEVIEAADSAGVINDQLRLSKMRCLRHMAENESDYMAAIHLCNEMLARSEPGRTKEWISQMYRFKSLCYLDCDEFEQAMEAITAAIGYDASDNWNYSVKAGILENMGEEDQALKMFLAILPKMPENPYILERVGRLYARKGDSQKALDHIKQILVIDEDYPELHRMLGLLYKELANTHGTYDYKDAIEAFSLQLQILDSVFDRIERGRLYLKVEQYGQAKEDFNKVLETEPENESAILGLGDVHFYDHDYQQALEYYQKTPINDSSKKFIPELYTKTGQCCESLGDLKQAKGYYAQGISIYPKYIPNYQILGDLYIKMHLYEDAVALFIRAMEIEHSDSLVFADKICSMFIALKDKNRAKIWWKRLLTEKKIFNNQFFGNYRAGQYYLYIDKHFGKADKYLKKALRASEDSKNDLYKRLALYSLGVTYFYLKRYKEAEVFFGNAIEDFINKYPQLRTGLDLKLISLPDVRIYLSILAWFKDGGRLSALYEAMDEVQKRTYKMMTLLTGGILAFAYQDYNRAKEMFETARMEKYLDIECEGMLHWLNER